MKSAVLFLILTAVSAAAWAQERRNGFAFTSPLLLSGGVEDQLLVGNRTVSDSTAVFSGPTLSLLKTAPRTEFELSYTPEFQMFSEHTDLNAWNHAAGLHFQYRFTPRLSLSIDDGLLRTQDPTRALGETVFLLPRGDFRENVFGTTLAYSLAPRWMLNFGYANTVSDLRIEQSTLPIISKQMANVGTVGVGGLLKARHRLSATYSLISFRDLSGRAGSLQSQPGISDPTHSGALTYRFGRERGIAFDASAGIMRGGIQSYLVSAGVERRWRTVMLRAAYGREISVFRGLLRVVTTGELTPALGETRLASGVLPSSVLQHVSIRFREKIGNRFGIDLRALAGRNESASESRHVNSLTGRLRLYFRITPRVSALVGAESYDQNFNQLLGRALERRRYYSGLLVSLSHRAQPIEITAAEQPGADITAAWPEDWGRE
ncbi:MAG: hypothetical protein HYX72_06645 [Acidobacteria bacterium]|nr:hypothetical protein [Acidobacteriota bacterium]